MAQEAVGRCLCGAVQFKVTGEPIYNVNAFLSFRRTSGSTFHTASIYLKKQYTLLQPPSEDPAAQDLPNITVYPDYDTQSGKPLYRRFCATCGAKISALTPLNNEIISVPAGILPDAGQEWKPQKEQFLKDKVGWVPELGDLVQTVKGPGSEVVGGLRSQAAESADERGRL
ncbi:hypothetical protein PMZ80_002283 [Knufia obscura]|uniref:CENP-V/GFA domain-containing protein n=2 Tax=Knufia TaxID=430999 RepID=A0AAN8I258_9EURO|nr:hypothetical protein PMZ80_002283 [Knufia obscura]KAK5950642.1 hypothetical protein OHC33_008308 [Knufia fluminis]